MRGESERNYVFILERGFFFNIYDIHMYIYLGWADG